MKNLLVKFSVTLLASIALFTGANAAEVSKTDPYKMIEEVSKITFDRFAREEAEIKENPELLKDIVREELMPYIFFQYAGLKVLGNYAKPKKGSTKQEVDMHRQNVREFLMAFREYLITSYAQVFTLYEQQQVQFEPAKKIGKQKIIMVGVDIIDENRPPINIKFKVRKNSKTNEWQAFDLVAEGISLLDAKQKELRSILAQNGVVEVTEMLKVKSDRRIVFKKNEDVDAKIEEQGSGNNAAI
ncbi:ABC transporter substrate-binding protein [Thalassotalea fonticola]|uniref:ABC transporter substrate-binding protein n=1 Tax=Thalassotalea fonticola TaxID=3065649 RepID=A0ABZ0GKF0_9GAMM|nr:ABC transporter substrate-binding protein [Colwelliaceae bacterium S1-1]